ncbi:hypothetical protein HEP73_00014 [Xanthomonas sp. GW]|uniref:hypothetical protein n=1 Tax=Xanthomonas sp. GW TaxID=2724121 RepID=UPI0016399049|nr:hypothetical protein [Xanthomonas sp. GW]QNH19128.1 hypothetical protein HEP73_00014 [Xanthomonas sp. GW]
MPQLDKQYFEDVVIAHLLRLVLLGFGMLFSLFFIATFKLDPLRGSAELGVSAV